MQPLRRRWLLILTITAATVVGTPRSGSSMNEYRPPLPSGVPAGYVRGVFLEFYCGVDGGECGVVFRKSDGARAVLLTAPYGSIMIDGRSFQCLSAPPHSYLCDDWPKNLEPGKTRIRMPYWWTRDEEMKYTFPYSDRITILP